MAEAVKELDMVLYEGGIGRASPRKEATQEGVDEGAGQCFGQGAGGRHPLQDLG